MFTERNCTGAGLHRQCTLTAEVFGNVYYGKSVVLEYVPHEKIVSAVCTNDGGVAYTETDIYWPHPRGTEYKMILNFSSFQIPAVYSGLSHDAIQGQLEKLIDAQLASIKAGVENQ